MSSFYAYLSAVFDHWQAFILGGLFVIDEVTKRILAPKIYTWLDSIISHEKRRKFEVIIMILAVFWAGFAAWKEEHNELEELKPKAALADALQTTVNKQIQTINDLQAKPQNPVAVTVKVLSSNANDDWPPLSIDEKIKLISALRKLRSQPIIVACETLRCKNLADDLNESLHAGGWDSKITHTGSMDAIGTNGISLEPSEEGTKYLKEAIEKTTNLKVNIEAIPRSSFGNEAALLVIGTKPF